MQRNRAFVSSQVSNWTGTRPILRNPQNVIVAKDAMIAWYTFQDSANDLAVGTGFANNIAYDLSTTNTSYVTNGFAPGIKSLSITESPASVVQNTSMPWSGDPRFSISMWVKRKANVKDGLWGIGGGSGTGQGINAYGIAFSPVNDIGWDLWAAQRFSTNQVYPLNEWVHVTWIKFGGMNETGLRCVINGVSYSVVPEGGSPSATPSLINGFSLGDISSNQTRDVTAMEVFDVRIFNRDLTVTEAQQIYASGLAYIPPPVSVEFLVIAGGGSGGVSNFNANATSGGGGAGGYRTSVVGAQSGGGASAESNLNLAINTDYTVTVGAGAPGATNISVNGSSGVASSIAGISTVGGGAGSSGESNVGGAVGGSGGGGAYRYGGSSGGSGTTNQGFAGGTPSTNINTGGGGGGAGAAGVSQAAGSTPIIGGAGLANSITGVSVTRATGGRGSFDATASPSLIDGAAGTGSGGAGYTNSNSPNRGGNGGSGVVILRYPVSNTINVGAGLTSSTITTGDTKVTTFTAGTGNITIS